MAPPFGKAKKRQGGVVVDRDYTLEYVASDTRGSSLRSSSNSDETYNDSSNIDWRRKIYAYQQYIMVDYKHMCIGMAHLEAPSRIQEPVSLLHIVDLHLQ